MGEGILRPVLIMCACLVLAGIMCISGLFLVWADDEYSQERDYHQVLLAYKPVPLADSEIAEESQPTNVGLLELQSRYPDVVGWLTVPGTQIDYPFVLPDDDEEYLRADLDHNYLASGTLFMDYRGQEDMTAFHSIIYGHYMKNESMFGSLPQFRKVEVFTRYSMGSLQLPHANYTLEIFASILTDRYDAVLYNCAQNTDEEKQAFLDYVKETAEQYRDIEVTIEDTFLTLSTCSYEFSDARTVVVARLTPE